MSGEPISIGDWTFDPASSELRRGEERRRLESRAGRTLELLLRRRGEVVSQEEIVADVWGGRHLSPNSIPVVIGDLRRALGDDAREPRYIETVAKRGYRLLPEVEVKAGPSPATPRRSAWLTPVMMIAALAIVAAFGAWRWSAQARPGVVVAAYDVVNATGDPAYDPLARKVSELAAADLSHTDGVSLVRNRASSKGVSVTAKLILWTGNPTVYFTAEDAETRKVIWTGMTPGPEPKFPANVHTAMGELTAKVRAEREAAKG
ncbi:MAG: winged helix-turn-helix domain-containing protein [Caulobacteraceae bacterium]